MTLSNEQLGSIWRSGEKLALPFFDGQAAELFFDDEAELLSFADVIRNFLTLGKPARTEATRHVFAYFKDFLNEAGWEWVDPAMRDVLTRPEEVWRFVFPNVIAAEESWEVGDKASRRKYLVVEGNCSWEQEHGILLSWRDGLELVKVSGFDGHATNGHAYSDLSKDAFIYHGIRPEMSTTR